MFKRSKKAQAALEYMITYGWAFIVIIAAISVLGYFGFLNPSKYIPESCEFGEQLKCVDYYVDDDGTIEFRFRNNFETDITLVSVSGDGINEPLGIDISDGEVKKIELDTTRELFVGTKERFDIEFVFQRDSLSASTHTLSGSLFAEVIEASVDFS